MYTNIILFKSYDQHQILHSFPTRRSSDLEACRHRIGGGEWTAVVRRHGRLRSTGGTGDAAGRHLQSGQTSLRDLHRERDRKSTRLNSSHTVISYAVFCFKKQIKYSSLINA